MGARASGRLPPVSPIQPKTFGSRRSERPNGWFRVGMAGVGYPVSALFKLRWHHQENIPQHGGVIVVANHISYVDPVVVGRYLYDAGRLPRFLAKDAIFEVPAVGAVMRGMGQVPVHRGGPEAQQALSSAVDALRRGEVVVVYPEGTVTRDPAWWPRSGKTGAARLALLAPEIPVLPVGQFGAQVFDVYRKSFTIVPRREAHVTSGPLVDLAEFRARVPEGVTPSTEVLRAMTRRIMAAVTAQVEVVRGQDAPGPRPVEGP